MNPLAPLEFIIPYLARDIAKWDRIRGEYIIEIVDSLNGEDSVQIHSGAAAKILISREYLTHIYLKYSQANLESDQKIALIPLKNLLRKCLSQVSRMNKSLLNLNPPPGIRFRKGEWTKLLEVSEELEENEGRLPDSQFEVEISVKVCDKLTKTVIETPIFNILHLKDTIEESKRKISNMILMDDEKYYKYVPKVENIGIKVEADGTEREKMRYLDAKGVHSTHTIVDDQCTKCKVYCPSADITLPCNEPR